jgi:general secretion pathway protein K
VSGNRGAALLLVVLLVSLLAVIVVEFQREARLEIRAAANLRDALRAHAIARSGAAVGSALLVADANGYDYREDDWTILNDLPLPLGEITVDLHLEDLDGKFPLGSLVDKGQVPDKRKKAYQRFLEALNRHLKDLPDLADADILDRADIPALVDALVDWIDENESGTYEEYFDAAYTVPNAPLASLEELYRIEGYNVVPEGYGHAIVEAILPYVDTRPDVEINVNTADVPVLAALHPHIDYDKAADWFDEITDTPAEGAFRPKDYPSVQRIAFSASPFKPVTQSKRFRVQIGVDVDGVYHMAEAVMKRENKRVDTVEWREGWVRRAWRHRTAPVSLPGGMDL